VGVTAFETFYRENTPLHCDFRRRAGDSLDFPRDREALERPACLRSARPPARHSRYGGGAWPTLRFYAPLAHSSMGVTVLGHERLRDRES
jgi:hypothetical protein